MDKYFYETNNGSPIDDITGTDYTNWYTDGTYTTHITVTQGLPATGDTVYWAGTATGGYAFAGVTFAANSPVYLWSDGDWSFDLHCVFGVGSSIFVDGPYPYSDLTCAAKWLGDISITGSMDTLTLDDGWKVNNAASGGNITLQQWDGDTGVIVNAPDSGQSSTYTNISVRGWFVDLSNWGNIFLLGTFTLDCSYGNNTVVPPGNWITLLSASASAFSVGMAIPSTYTLISNVVAAQYVLVGHNNYSGGSAGTLTLPNTDGSTANPALVSSAAHYGPDNATAGTATFTYTNTTINLPASSTISILGSAMFTTCTVNVI